MDVILLCYNKGKIDAEVIRN